MKLPKLLYKTFRVQSMCSHFASVCFVLIYYSNFAHVPSFFQFCVCSISFTDQLFIKYFLKKYLFNLFYIIADSNCLHVNVRMNVL